MKFNTSKYKLSVFTEDVCEECQALKEKLSENNIPFLNLSISTETKEQKLSNGNNRWDFIDAESDDTRFKWFTPVLIIEDTLGNTTYIPSVVTGTNCENGDCFETVDDIDGVLQPYLQ
tara:strand:+ start:45 stop:398 length:354 start_codon:yes stop_codon:yes gene_type:complete